MSIELDTARFGKAVLAVMMAQHAIGVAMRELDRAQHDIKGQLAFGNDPATPDGKILHSFGEHVGELMSAVIQADIVSPHCGEAMDALRRIQAASRNNSPAAPIVPAFPSAMQRVSARLLTEALS
jgi:hypothetical protein